MVILWCMSTLRMAQSKGWAGPEPCSADNTSTDCTVLYGISITLLLMSTDPSQTPQVRTVLSLRDLWAAGQFRIPPLCLKLHSSSLGSSDTRLNGEDRRREEKHVSHEQRSDLATPKLVKGQGIGGITYLVTIPPPEMRSSLCCSPHSCEAPIRSITMPSLPITSAEGFNYWINL